MRLPSPPICDFPMLPGIHNAVGKFVARQRLKADLQEIADRGQRQEAVPASQIHSDTSVESPSMPLTRS